MESLAIVIQDLKYLITPIRCTIQTFRARMSALSIGKMVAVGQSKITNKDTMQLMVVWWDTVKENW